MTHWTTAHLSKPYVAGAQGPDSFNCWGLVRTVYSECCDLVLPLVNIGQHDRQDREIREAARVGSFHPQHPDTLLRDFDILLMWGPHGRHVALGVVLDGVPMVYHALEEMGVVLTRLSEMWVMGFKEIVIWRRT